MIIKTIKKIYKSFPKPCRCEFCGSDDNVGSWTGEYISMCESCYKDFKQQEKRDDKRKERKKKLKQLGI